MIYLDISSSKIHEVTLPVTTNGMEITVGTGTVKINNVSYPFDEEEFVTVSADSDNLVDVIGYLAVDKSTGALRVIVDEIIRDGIDVPYTFDVDSPYQLLWYLFTFSLPPSTTTLDGVPINVSHSNIREGSSGRRG